jgi:hypothetical protein
MHYFSVCCRVSDKVLEIFSLPGDQRDIKTECECDLCGESPGHALSDELSGLTHFYDVPTILVASLRKYFNGLWSSQVLTDLGFSLEVSWD